MPRFKDDAICIRLIDWSETSQVVALLTRDHGKLRGLAKGSKRLSPSSVARFSGGIELLTQGEVVANTRPSAELASITEWDLQRPHTHLRANLQAQQIAFYAADLAHAMLADEDPHPRIYHSLLTLLEALEDPAKHEASLLRYQWDVLDDCGYRPELNGAGDEASDHDQAVLAFDPLAGAFVAERQDSHRGTGSATRTAAAKGRVEVSPVTPWRVRRETVDCLRSIANESKAKVDADSPDAATIGRANRLLCSYARHLLDRQLPTMAYLLGDAE